MKTTKKAVRGDADFYAVLCRGYVDKDLICGVLSTLEEAKELAKGIEGCVAPHVIKKCKVTISFPSALKKKTRSVMSRPPVGYPIFQGKRGRSSRLYQLRSSVAESVLCDIKTNKTS